MFPILFKIGPFTFHTYGLLVALGVFVGLKITIALARQESGNPAKTEQDIYALLSYFILGGLIGGRLAYVLIHWQQFVSAWTDVFKIWEGGLVAYGGLIGALAGFMLWYRKHPDLGWRKVTDCLAPAIAFGHALGRLGCFSAGCCYGKPTTVPWAVTFSDPSSLALIGIPLHPVQFYESVFLIVLGFFLFWRWKQKRWNPSFIQGMVFADYLIVYSAGRFFMEFFRGDDIRIWHTSPGQICSIIIFTLAILYRIFLHRHPQKF
jgi:phosphatidylglycerol:prolipoprotein diacylglycerol transferase